MTPIGRGPPHPPGPLAVGGQLVHREHRGHRAAQLERGGVIVDDAFRPAETAIDVPQPWQVADPRVMTLASRVELMRTSEQVKRPSASSAGGSQSLSTQRERNDVLVS